MRKADSTGLTRVSLALHAPDTGAKMAGHSKMTLISDSKKDPLECAKGTNQLPHFQNIPERVGTFIPLLPPCGHQNGKVYA
jgi:hypothetical protein